MTSKPVIRAKMDELLAFLPLFETPGREFIVRWVERQPDGTLVMPYPLYAEDVVRFFHLAGQSCWADYGYVPAEAARMLEDDDVVQRATLEQIKTMLTYCVRGERFCDGFWGQVLRSGRLTALLRRLAVLREA